MKLVLVAAALAAFSSQSFAAFTGPFAVKASGTGFTSQEWTRSERCELFADKVVITKVFGIGAKLVEQRAISLTGDIFAVVAAASSESVTQTPNLLCDGPSTTIAGNERVGNDGAATVVLYTTGGCGSPTVTRTGPASDALKDILNTYCPLTYTAGPGH